MTFFLFNIMMISMSNEYNAKDPDGEIENSGKSIFEIRIPNFCYIQVKVCDLS